MKLTTLAVALLTCLLCSGGKAAAADYVVNYAFDLEGKTDAGRKETCEYVRPCQIESESLGMRIILVFTYPDHRSVYVTVHGKLGCCYFSDGVDSISLDPKSSLHHLKLFEGKARRRNEFVGNTKVGVLYLTFSDLQP
jgi:hypothetical protein